MEELIQATQFRLKIQIGEARLNSRTEQETYPSSEDKNKTSEIAVLTGTMEDQAS